MHANKQIEQISEIIIQHLGKMAFIAVAERTS